MDKQALVAQIHGLLSAHYERLERAFRESKEYATDPDSKAESKYDTRGLEASYLAAGQAEEVERLAESVASFDDLVLPEFDDTSVAGAGALVEADRRGDLVFYLLAPAGGGIQTEYLGCDLSVLTPEAPLYQDLLGSRVGDILEEQGITVLDLS